MTNPTDAEKMREMAAQVIDQANANGPYQAIAAASVIRALPLPTPARTYDEEVSQILHDHFKGDNMTPGDWTSGAILGAGSSWRDKVLSATAAILALIKETDNG